VSAAATQSIIRIKRQPALRALFDLPIWGCSGGTLDNGKPDKAPRSWRNPQYHAKSNTPATWGTFAQIEQAALRFPHLIDHVGIFTSPAVSALDWDYKPHAEVPAIVQAQAAQFADNYQEVSTSGRGLRCLLLAAGLKFKKRKLKLEPGVDLEIFGSHQYAILTGNAINQGAVLEAGEELSSLLASLEPAQPEPTPRKATPRSTPTGSAAPYWEVASTTWRIADHLERAGYARKAEGRYLAPQSDSGAAGVIVFRGQDGYERCISYHANDPLNNNHANDVFDVFALLEHGGNYKAAIPAACELLGLGRAQVSSDLTALGQLTAGPLTAQEAQQLWDQHGSDVLSRAGEYLTARQMHHHARESVVNLLAYSYQAAAEGQLIASGPMFTLNVGGLQSFAALVGGKTESLRARMETLKDLGMVHDFCRADPSDSKSSWLIKLPGDPRTLPFLGHTPSPFEPPLRPQTTNVRRGEKFTVPASKAREAKAAGTVNPDRHVNPLRALLRMVLQLSKHPGHTAEWHAGTLGMRLNTARKQLSQLAELGYLTTEGKLTCTYQQFFEDMRAWNAERASRRLIKVFDRQQNFAAHTITLARLGVEEARQKVGRMKRLAERCAAGIIRLQDGEAPHMVIGRAA